MRKFGLLLCSVAAILFTAPAWADDSSKPTPASVSKTNDDTDIEVVPAVTQGDQIGIACNALAKSNADSDVRVVLTISAAPGETPPDYQKVLATDAEVGHGAVRVRIPSLPDLANQTVNVNVYVVGDKGSDNCDAGHVKIVRGPIASHPVG